jgi:hypothetical protein
MVAVAGLSLALLGYGPSEGQRTHAVARFPLFDRAPSPRGPGLRRRGDDGISRRLPAAGTDTAGTGAVRLASAALLACSLAGCSGGWRSLYPLVAGAAAGHGATIECTSHPGRGTMFTVFLPGSPDRGRPAAGV